MRLFVITQIILVVELFITDITLVFLFLYIVSCLKVVDISQVSPQVAAQQKCFLTDIAGDLNIRK